MLERFIGLNIYTIEKKCFKFHVLKIKTRVCLPSLMTSI